MTRRCWGAGTAAGGAGVPAAALPVPAAPPPVLVAALPVLVAALLTAGCGDAAQDSLRRGDRLLAEQRLEAAVAEYRLARRQAGAQPQILLRLGHAYALLGDVDASLRHYDSLLVRDSSYRYQAASDLSWAARRALERDAPENMVRALEPVVDWSMGLIPPDLRLALARHYWEDGEYARALPLFLSVLQTSEDVPPLVYYETARAYEELSGCSESLELFETFLSRGGSGAPEYQSARWHYGNCLFRAAEEDRAAGRPQAALTKLERMVELGVPQTLLERAHFYRGEMLLALGEPEEALAAYRRVLDLNPTRSGFLVRQAEQRIRDIRFGYQF